MTDTSETRKWRNAFYDLPARYDANAYVYDPVQKIKICRQKGIKVTDKILHEAAKRARKGGKP